MSVPPLTGGELNAIQCCLRLLDGEDTPLQLMNRVTQWKEGERIPEMDEQWLRKIAMLCEIAVALKRSADVLRAEIERLKSEALPSERRPD